MARSKVPPAEVVYLPQHVVGKIRELLEWQRGMPRALKALKLEVEQEVYFTLHKMIPAKYRAAGVDGFNLTRGGALQALVYHDHVGYVNVDVYLDYYDPGRKK